MVLHDVLFWRSRGTMRVFVPSTLRSQLIHEFHDIPIAGHLGWRKTHQALAQHYFWPGMAESVHKYVTRCATCQRIKPTKQPKQPLTPLRAPWKPFQEMTMDWISGFRTDKHQHTPLLHIVDRFSKWVICIPTTKSMTTNDLFDTLYKEVFSWVGLPEAIITDRDPRMTASVMRSLAKYLQVKLKLSTSYHPQTGGQTERFHSTMLQMMRAFVNHHHSNCSEHIPPLLYAYHNTIHKATGSTPHMLLFG